MVNKRGSNRLPGAPALPGAGRPPNSATIKAGNPIMASRVFPDGVEHIGTGTVSITRSGNDRIVKIALDDGSTLILTVF